MLPVSQGQGSFTRTRAGRHFMGATGCQTTAVLYLYSSHLYSWCAKLADSDHWGHCAANSCGRTTKCDLDVKVKYHASDCMALWTPLAMNGPFAKRYESQPLMPGLAGDGRGRYACIRKVRGAAARQRSPATAGAPTSGFADQGPPAYGVDAGISVISLSRSASSPSIGSEPPIPPKTVMSFATSPSTRILPLM